MRILWNDNRDGEGIVIDSEGNEYYFNQSTSPLFDFAKHNHYGISFELRELPYYGLVAWNVKSYYST